MISIASTLRHLTRLCFAALVGMAAGGPAMAVLVEMTDIVGVKAGTANACALTSAGGLLCWGANGSGQLGDGTIHHRYFAGYVSGLSTGVVAMALSGGRDYSNLEGRTGGHACAVLLSGGIRCWGLNASGQLGDGTTTERSTPVDVVGLGGPAVAVAAGGDHTCALLNTGAVQCWGNNGSGQLGDNTTAPRLAPADVVALGSGIVQIAAAGRSTCALTSSGAVKCWGANGAGQLGDGTRTTRLAPVDVSSLSSGVASITLGGSRTSPEYGNLDRAFACAAMVSGVTKCWGDNGLGQLGDASFDGRLTPVDVLLPVVVSRVSGGGAAVWTTSSLVSSWNPNAHACALTTGGGVKCWGSNQCGQLGIGGSPICWQAGGPGFNSPMDVLPSGVTDLASGGVFTCALTASATVRCWGEKYGSTHETISTGSQPQTIVIMSMPTNVPVGSTGIVTARSSTNADLSVAFASASPEICSVSATTLVRWHDASGGSTRSHATVSGLAPGMCTLTADQPGSATYEPAPQVTFDFPVGAPVGQTITFGPAPTVVLYGTGTVSATASSGLAVTFGSNTPSVCSVSGGVVTGLSIGSCTIRANQAGDRLYGPIETTQTFPIGPNSGTVSLAVSKLGPGTGTVKADSPLIDCGAVCSADFAVGAQVVLTAAAAANSTFVGWSGSTCSGTGPCTVTMNAATTITATFTTASLTISKPGLGYGTVRANSPLINCGSACSADFPLGTQVVLIAEAAPNSIFAGWSGSTCSGTGTCTVTMNASTTIVANFTSTLPRLGNIASRGRVQTGDEVMIGGFVIAAGSTSKRVAIVVTGPSLVQYGIANPLANPMLTLVRSSDQAVIATNDDWQTAANQADLTAAGFAPPNALEAAILADLAPGAYTAIVSGAGGGTGVAVTAIYEVDRPEVRLVNLSTRGKVLTGDDVMIGGFIINGTGQQTVAIVATGPSLGAYGITNPLANPKITLVRSSDQAVIAINDDWQADANATQLQLKGLAPSHTLEAAILVTLPPGAYTAIVEGVGGTTGVAVVGVYAVQ